MKTVLSRRNSAFTSVLALIALCAAAPATAQQFGAEVVYRFEPSVDGYPTSLLQASDGNFYGVTDSRFSTATMGALFRLRADGLFTVIHRFTGGADGNAPGPLIQANDGHLYGLTSGGGAHGLGTAFRMTLDGQFTVLHAFSGTPDGGRPAGGLMQGSDGGFYGVTSGGGTSDRGTAFRMSADGTIAVIRHFGTETPSDGYFRPQVGLVESDGVFYGILSNEWTGQLYRLSRDGATLSLIYQMDLSDGDYSVGVVPTLPIRTADGQLYGASGGACKGNKGVFYRIAANGVVTTIRQLGSCVTGMHAPLTEVRDGSFVLPGIRKILHLTRDGQLSTLYDSGTSPDLTYPQGRLVQVSNGDLYGATMGINDATIFRARPTAMAPVVRINSRAPVQLSWNVVFEASSYTVMRRDAAGQVVAVGRVSGTGFVDHTALSGQRYVYSVTATTPYGESAAAPALAIVNKFVSHDVDGDGHADVTIYRPSAGEWWTTYSSGIPSSVTTWGMAADLATPGDYDGDGVMDVAVYRPSTGTWYVRGQAPVTWGEPADVPVTGDYDGNGVTDIAVFRRSNGTWYVRGRAPVAWGQPGDVPVPADFDGDGATDLAVYRPSTGTWYVRGLAPIAYGNPGDIPVPADYDGDGDADIAVFRDAIGTWFVKDQLAVSWGAAGDIPLTLDRDGDGRTELAVYRRRLGTWFFRSPNADMTGEVSWGQEAGDVPIGRGLPQQLWIRAHAGRDFDGDNRDDVMVFRPSTAFWFLRHSDRDGQEAQPWRAYLPEDAGVARAPFTGDFDGDGRLDLVDYRPAIGQWIIKDAWCCRAVNQWGTAGDIPVPADYDGDGVTDQAVFRPSSATWFIARLGNVVFGQASDLPVPADYDGDGATDVAVYRDGEWIIRGGAPIRYGASGDIPVPADYDGNGTVDIAVYRPSTGTWFVRGQLAVQWGAQDDVPVPLDRDGDGRAELIVYRPSTGTWYFTNLATGIGGSLLYGQPGDIPVGRGFLWIAR